MFRTMLKSKLHRATVTQSCLNYIGSITIDADLMAAADIYAGEKVQVVNNNNGARLETYAIAGERGSGIICLNGAAARLVQPGDTVIIITYVQLDDQTAQNYQPTVVFLNENNTIAEIQSGEQHGEIR
ncbi:aspartate 1-decarboxylase|uniref:Aspartate 1-decarboxylase n=1 Tax=Dendrosporobacter quercicolus TaxID=146817 RepID=A0A1G9V0Z2_9FIRM|nr:aspartate 1-decarboxylase [Dendrosporobacter quercicolus]NSL47962.1 aspartate 1-decarboxylase [Dendrosporobacter quercicolus DSM 1736]SDM65773.1 L-aspartate 1-decarboxylase [Dendrosporobacter quercicolus]